MKRIIIDLRYKLGLFLLTILTGGYAIAGTTTTDTLSESDYNYTPSTNTVTMYNSPIPFIVLGVVILGMIYVGYRYWRDNVPDDDTKHTPHHQ